MVFLLFLANSSVIPHRDGSRLHTVSSENKVTSVDALKSDLSDALG
jgi:hypothetical protein